MAKKTVYILSPGLFPRFKAIPLRLDEEGLYIHIHCTLHAPRISPFQSHPIPIKPINTLVERVSHIDTGSPSFQASIRDNPSWHQAGTVQLILEVTTTNPEAEIFVTEKEHLTTIAKAVIAPSPSSIANNVKVFKSEQGKHPLYNGRPYGQSAAPVGIYDKTLAWLKENLDNLPATATSERFSVSLAGKLLLASTDIYDDESERVEGVCTLLELLLDVKFKTKVETDSGATVEVETQDPEFGDKKAIIVQVEVKNELGTSGDSLLQGALTFRRSRLLPQPTPRLGGPGQPINGIQFRERLHYSGRQSGDFRQSLFLAYYEGQLVVVKFTERYHEQAHRMLADVGLAPKLYGCYHLIGGGFMVVMDYVQGQDAHHRFENTNLPLTILSDIQHAVTILHSVGLVYGDLRRVNIMTVPKPAAKGDGMAVDFNEGGILIDFDWVGRDGQDHYPALLNDTGEIDWAEGVLPGGVMRKQHDVDMLKKLNP
ncbi:hypothetical protein Clacol_008959 [Clathrus columnatus]|uniref:Non-specific serine/threonine protein kinase n=1 Tax=Clathrus columnatus TaxID=1419009 RepID=A0AAV5ALQ3_9AGAM|nr:hypothetical protein Clacol_008959 [Clathrus columnatus]